MDVLDLTGDDLKVDKLPIKISAEKTIEVSTDFHPLLIARAHKWLNGTITASGDPDSSDEAFWDEGWEIAESLCKQDVREVGWRGLVRLLAFFRDIAWATMGTPSSDLPSDSDELSREASSLPTSSDQPD